MSRAPILLALALSLAGRAALAETGYDLVFREGTLDALPAGTELLYDDAESAVAQAPAERRTLALTLDAAEQAKVEAREPGATAARPMGSFDATVGNPLAMVFLERTVSSIAEATGGSPFYIRNRIRDALYAPTSSEPVTVPWAGGEVAATAVTLAPFAEDEHRAQLGAFADLTLRFVLSEEVPGWYVSIDAEAPAVAGAEGYAATLALRAAP